jgi:hypothetical protein
MRCYYLYYFLIYILEWKFFRLKTCIDLYYYIFNFYQINKDCDIRIRDRLVIKVLILCQITNLIQKLKLLDKILIYDFYYFLIKK